MHLTAISKVCASPTLWLNKFPVELPIRSSEGFCKATVVYFSVSLPAIKNLKSLKPVCTLRAQKGFPRETSLLFLL